MEILGAVVNPYHIASLNKEFYKADINMVGMVFTISASWLALSTIISKVNRDKAQYQLYGNLL